MLFSGNGSDIPLADAKEAASIRIISAGSVIWSFHLHEPIFDLAWILSSRRGIRRIRHTRLPMPANIAIGSIGYQRNRGIVLLALRRRRYALRKRYVLQVKGNFREFPVRNDLYNQFH
jgi:hypothetical protein